LRLPFEDDFLVKDINPVSISTSGYIRPTITIERLGSNLAPRYRSKQEKTTTTKKKKKTTLPTYSPTKLPTPGTSKHHKRRRSMTSKATPSRRKQRDAAAVAPPKTQRNVSTRRTPTKAGSILTHRLQGAPRRPKTPPMLTPTPQPGRLSPDASSTQTRCRRER
jgi:transposase